MSVAFSIAATALASSGYTELTGADLIPREKAEVTLDGYLRLRGEALSNLDLDTGTSPAGQPLFPVPIDSPSSQTLTYADSRLRTDLAVYAPGGQVAVKARVDVLDNLELGGNPELSPLGGTSPTPAASTGQTAIQGLRIKRAWGEALTPVGVIAAGRMSANWGMGIVTNGGDCLDCDSGDAADRIAFVTPVAGHLWAASYDFTWSGPSLPRPSGVRWVEIDPSAAVRTWTIAVLSYREDWARARRRRAGKTTFEYGAFASLRTQDQDVPAAYLPLAAPATVDASQVLYRGFRATALDAWARVTAPWANVQAELAVLSASVAQTSVIPGVTLRDPFNATQVGAALESELGAPEDRWGGGLDLGYASGGTYGMRFSPDYRIDEILFREIEGTVTNALYARPHARWTIASGLSARLAAVASMTAVNSQPLGVEMDPSVSYDSPDGFHALLEYGLLFPLAALGATARPAQLLRLRLAYVF